MFLFLFSITVFCLTFSLFFPCFVCLLFHKSFYSWAFDHCGFHINGVCVTDKKLGVCGMCLEQCWDGQRTKEGPYTGLPVLLLFSELEGTIDCTTSNRATSLNRRGPKTQGTPSSWPLKQWPCSSVSTGPNKHIKYQHIATVKLYIQTLREALQVECFFNTNITKC